LEGQKTYQSWNGLEDLDILKNDRTFNTAGIYTDEFGKTRFYDNETDNYQHHYQLHWNEKLSTNWNTNLAFHYTKGKGTMRTIRRTLSFLVMD
jgi:iron complex outermembrane receptor protein